MREGWISSEDVIMRLRALDQDFLWLVEGMPPSWLFQTTHVEIDSDATLGDCYDIYPDHFITQTYGLLRIMCILLNSIIRKFYKKVARGSHHKTPNPKSHITAETIDILAKQNCASVPQYTRCAVAISKYRTGLESKRYDVTLFAPCSTLPDYMPVLPLRSSHGSSSIYTACQEKLASGTRSWLKKFSKGEMELALGLCMLCLVVMRSA